MTKLTGEDGIDDTLSEGDLIEETDKIIEHVTKYYAKLYSKVNTHIGKQN